MFFNFEIGRIFTTERLARLNSYLEDVSPQLEDFPSKMADHFPIKLTDFFQT